MFYCPPPCQCTPAVDTDAPDGGQEAAGGQTRSRPDHLDLYEDSQHQRRKISSPIMVMVDPETRGTPDMSPLSQVVTPSPSPSPAPSPGMTELPEVRVTESEDVFEFAEIETSRSLCQLQSETDWKQILFRTERSRMFEDDYEDYIPVSRSSASQLPPSKPRMPRISPRRLSLSLAESFNQLEIPFKPRRKTSVPASPSSVAVTPDTREADHAKLNYFARREVGVNQ